MMPGLRPNATMRGMAGWSPGNQSAGPKGFCACASVNFKLLPGNCLRVVSGGPFRAGIDLLGSVPYGQTGMELTAVLPLEKQSRLAVLRVASEMLQNPMRTFNGQ